mgnify:FL=1
MIEMIEVALNALLSYAILALLSLITLSIEALLVGTFLRLFTWSKDHNWNYFYNKYNLSTETPAEKVLFSFQENHLVCFLVILLKAWLGYIVVLLAHIALLAGVGATAYSLYKLWRVCVW